MNVREHTWDKQDPTISYDKTGKKYEWFEDFSYFFYCKDEQGNEFLLRLDGTFYPEPKGTIWLNWNYATKEEVMQKIENAKSKVA